jgi:REP element-mobilizing transposase RayT
MARQPRDDAPGVAHHVMIRGIERRAIFVDDTDREDFLVRLARLALELGFLVFAWVLMPNHVHLVVRSAHAHISRLMSRLGTGYARRFNERHERVGHLFENRFRSRRVMDDADLLGLVLYVTRNPLEAGLVRDAATLEGFAWCGLVRCWRAVHRVRSKPSSRRSPCSMPTRGVRGSASATGSARSRRVGSRTRRRDSQCPRRLRLLRASRICSGRSRRATRYPRRRSALARGPRRSLPRGGSWRSVQRRTSD